MSTLFQATTSGACPQRERLFGTPPMALRLLIEELFANKLTAENLPVTYVMANQISQDVLNQLNEFAASVAQNNDCRIVALHHCSSCYEGNDPGNLVTTEDGWMQCWKCDPNG
jgi:hypothetical protein